MDLKNQKVTQNPFLLFFPFLILYLVIIFIFATPIATGDESRYLMYARNLSMGFYTLAAPHLDLGNGPGYSLIITPFVALKLPVLYIRLMNGLFYYFSIILLFKSLERIVTFKFALIISVIWGLYPNTFEQLPHVSPEVLASLLIPLLLFSVTSAFKANKTKETYKYIAIAGLAFGYLALTKPIFGYVLLFMIGGTIILWSVNKRNVHFKKSIAVLAIAFLITLPWLAYTYHMTGKLLYWSSYGGNNLYWMASPYEHEYGDWMAYPLHSEERDELPGTEEQLKVNHQKDFEQIFVSKEAQALYMKNEKIHGSPYTGVIQDETLQRIAFRNVLSHPVKFIQNCFSNVGRILFNFPYSYKVQKPETLLRLPFNGTILVFILFSLIATIINWEKIIFALRFLLFFSFLYLSGSILGSAETRMFTIIVPILLFWIAYILERTTKIKMKFNK
jgi:hypothetical protein